MPSKSSTNLNSLENACECTFKIDQDDRTDRARGASIVNDLDISPRNALKIGIIDTSQETTINVESTEKIEGTGMTAGVTTIDVREIAMMIGTVLTTERAMTDGTETTNTVADVLHLDPGRTAVPTGVATTVHNRSVGTPTAEDITIHGTVQAGVRSNLEEEGTTRTHALAPLVDELI